MSPGGRYGAVLVVFVLLFLSLLFMKVKKPIRFPMKLFSLHINHYLKNDFNENPQRFFISRLFRERGGLQQLRGEL